MALISIIYNLIQNLKLKELDNLKGIFIASTSHELRTPLTSILGFTRMLLKGWVGEINEEQEKQLKIILKSTNHLHKLIDDVIDVSKIEADKLDIKRYETDGKSLLFTFNPQKTWVLILQKILEAIMLGIIAGGVYDFLAKKRF